MDRKSVQNDWKNRGYSFGVFTDPPGQRLEGYVHDVDELLMLAEGEIEIEMQGKTSRPAIGEEIFIPARAVHSVRNVGSRQNVWFYGYKER